MLHVLLNNYFMFINNSCQQIFVDVLTATKNKNTNEKKVEILLDENFQNYGIIVIDIIIFQSKTPVFLYSRTLHMVMNI